MGSGRIIGMDEVCDSGYVVVGDGVYDLSNFVQRHRGGRFIELLAGTNASHIVWNAHAKNPAVVKMLEAYRVGTLDTATLPDVDRDLLALREKFVDEGLFRYPTAWLVGDVVRLTVLFVLAFAGVWLNPWLGTALWTIASIDLVWWIHDAGHDSIFQTEARARRVIEFLGITFLGMPQQGYHYVVHRIHHGFTNVIGVDQALQTGPIVWDARMKHRTNDFLLALQPFLWFLLVIPFATLALVGGAVVGCVRRRNYLLVAAFILRWLFVIQVVFGGNWLAAVLPPVIAGAILAFMAGLNHFHLPMSEELDRSYLRGVVERTQNIGDAGWLWAWMAGGLEHHIEHHLFASMPRRNYPQVAPHVQALCARHGLPYRSCTKLEAVANLYTKLSAPFGRVNYLPRLSRIH
jgi:fatty acid desaturase